MLSKLISHPSNYSVKCVLVYLRLVWWLTDFPAANRNHATPSSCFSSCRTSTNVPTTIPCFDLAPSTAAWALAMAFRAEATCRRA